MIECVKNLLLVRMHSCPDFSSPFFFLCVLDEIRTFQRFKRRLESLQPPHGIFHIKFGFSLHPLSKHQPSKANWVVWNAIENLCLECERIKISKPDRYDKPLDDIPEPMLQTKQIHGDMQFFLGRISAFHLRSRLIRTSKHAQSIQVIHMHHMHFLAIAAGGIRTAFFHRGLLHYPRGYPSLALGNARSPKL